MLKLIGDYNLDEYVAKNCSKIQYNIKTWDQAFRRLYIIGKKQNKINPELIVPKKNLPNPRKIKRFDRSEILSIEEGAKYVFRDNRKRDSLQVRLYEGSSLDRIDCNYNKPVYSIQLDQYNPSEGFCPAIKHLFKDVLGVSISDL